MSSKQVDERVVQMKFDNADFQRKTAETITMLDRLKAALHLDGFKGLKDLSDATKDLDMSGATKSVEECANKFSILEVAGVTAIAKITSAAMDMGIKFVKSMSIDRVTDGFTRYAQKTSAVQTIMAATAKDFSDVGTQMAYVNDQLDKLAWFTDETSYSFNEMVNNIGKFTSNNIKLDQAVTAMQGISTWAAVSGANISDANRAMYNLSQAVGAGSVKLIDWKSIENANMATYDFKKNVAETAVQMGTLSRAGDGVYKTLKGTTFTLAQFNTELDKGWFSSEVLLNTLNKYGGATEILYDLYDATGKTTKSILDNAEKFKNGDADFIKKWAEESDASVEELTDLFTKLTDAQNELGLKSFRAAQEAKTFQEAIDATAEAVGSKWMKTFEYIFGNYQEAKKLWSGLAEFLYDEFASSGDVRNDILKSWKEVGEVEGDVINGRNELLRATVNLLNLIIKPLRSMKKAFSDAFNLENARDIGNTLSKATKAFADFTEKIQPSQKVLQAFYATARSVAEIFKTITYLIGSFISAIAPGVEPVQKVGDGLAGIVITINKYIYVAAKMIQNSKTIPMIFNAIGSALRLCYTIFVKVGTYVGGGLVFAFSKLKIVIQNVAKLLSGLGAPLANLGNSFVKFKSFVSESIRQNRALSTVFASEKDQLKDVKDAVNGAAESTKGLSEETTFLGKVFAIVIGTIKEFPKVIMTIASLIGGVLLKVVTTIGNVFKKVFKTIYDDFKDANSIGEGFKNLIEDVKEGIKGMLDGLGINGDKFFEFIDNAKEGLKGLFEHLTVGKILAVAFSVAMLVMIANMSNVAKAITTAVGAFGTLAGNINKILKNKFLSKATPILEVAKAFALVAASLALLSTVAKEGGLGEATASMIAIIVAIGGFAIAMKLLDRSIAKAGFEAIMPSWAKSMISLSVAVGVLSLALIALNKVSIESLSDVGSLLIKLGAIATLMGSLVLFSAILSTYAPELSKNSLALLAVASAVAILVKALAKLNEIKVDETAMSALEVLLVGLVAVTLAAEHIKLRQALGILAIAAAFRLALPAIEELATKMSEVAQTVANSDKFVQYVITFVLALAGMVAMAVIATKAITPLVSALGAAVIEIGLGVFLLAQSAAYLQELATSLNVAELAKLIGTIAGLSAVIVAFVVLLRQINGAEGVFSQKRSLKQLIGLSVLMLSFATSLKIMASAMTEVANIYANGGLGSLILCTLVISALTLVLSSVIKASGACESAKSALVAMISIIATLSAMVIALVVLTLVDAKELIMPVIAIGVLMGVLAAVFAQMAKIKKVDTSVVIAMVGSLLILAGSLVLLATQPIGNVFTAMVALGAIMGLLTTVMETISGKSGLANTKKIGVLVAISGMLLIASGSLIALSTIPWNSMWPALIGMGAAFAAVLGATFVLSKIPAVNPITLVSFGIMSACVLAFAATAKVMEGIDAFDFLKKMGVIVLALGVLTGISIIATAVSAGLWALSGVMVAFGAAVLMSSAGFSLISSVFKELQNVDLLSVAGGLAAMAGSLLLLTIPAALLGIVSLNFLGLAVALAAVSLASLGIETFVSSMERLANLDVLGLSVGMLSLSGSLVAISALSLGLPIVALALMTLAGGVAAVSFAALGFGTFADAIERLGNVNILGMAGGLSALALPLVAIATLGFALPVAAAGIAMLSASLAMFSGSLGMVNVVITGFGESVNLMLGFFDNMVTGVSNFLNRIWQFLTFIPRMLFSSSQTTAQVASKSGQLVGGSYIEGFNDGAGFHSPIERIVAFFKEVTGQFTGDTSMSSAAAQSGQNVGQSWSSKLWKTIKGVFGKIIEAIKGLFKKIGGIADDLDLDLGFDASNFSFEMPDFQSMLGDGTDYAKQFEEALAGAGIEGLNYEDIMADVETQMGDLTGATGAGAAATSDFGEEMDGAGKASKKTKKELTATEEEFKKLAESMTSASDAISGFKSISASNPFEAYEEKEVIDPKNVIENMKNISKTTSGWMDNLNLLFRRGVHTNLLKYLEELGIEGRDMVAAFVKMSDEQLEEAQGLFNHNLGYSEENAQSMLNSMHRKLDQVQQWGHNIKTLIERGLDEGIVKKLTDLGPDSADQVAAFASMTEDQLIEANAMFTAAMQISADGAGSIIASFAETGDTAAQEFIQGINNGEYGYIEAGRGMGLSVLNALRESLDTHSPSKETEEIGENTGYGLRNGLANTQKTISATAKWVAESTINNFKVYLSADRFEKLGTDAMQGLINGINTKGAEAVSAAEGIAAKCAEIMAQKWEVHSPSRLMRRMGVFFSEGAAIGIEEGAESMYQAAATVADGTVDQFNTFAAQVNDAINFNFNPIITPKLDLSYIRSQMSEINSMFNDGTISMTGEGQNGDNSSKMNGNQPIVFNQNNYSPKALSRTEIYRYTHNQLSLAGGYLR